MKYASLMFDIVESRKYRDRYIVQTILMNSIEYLNHIYGYGIKKEVVPSAGDDFQGLFMDVNTAFLYIRKLQLLICPIKIRGAIGYGKIEYDVSEWTSSAFSGEAYYLAREAINSIPKRKGNIVCVNTSSTYDKYINMYCLANADVKSRQSQMARWIELIADVIAPIKPIDEDIEIYNRILKGRASLIDSEYYEKNTGRTRDLVIFDTNFDFLSDLKSSYAIEKSEKNSLYMESFWEHGMATDIAHVMNTSRQNVDRYVSSRKIKESRTMDKAIFEMLGELCQ